MKHLLLLLTVVCTQCALAATLRVGPLERITRIADAARLAQDGDVVEIMPGTYRGDVAVWQQKNLTIIGTGERPVLLADGKNAEGKAIWVIRNGQFHIENIEFRGARVADANGAGIRFERGKLLVRRCNFIDNQNGILTSNFADAELTIEDSLFAQAPHQPQSLPHLLYVGRIARVTITGSRFHNGYRGHLIKSRARRSDIRYNLIYDGEQGQVSYAIDLPNGGVATLVGNIVGQSATTQNPVLVAYGAEGNTWPASALTLSHNTLISDYPYGAWFLRVFTDKFTQPPKVLAVNNLTVGIGAFTVAASGEFHGNVPAVSAMLQAPERLDFRLPRTSPLRLLGTDTTPVPPDAIPSAEFALPIGTRPLPPPERWVPGAMQH